jgi:hypothetical protein
MGLSLRVHILRTSVVWPNARQRSGISQLWYEGAAVQRLLNQRHGPTGPDQPRALFQPSLGGRFDDVWRDVLAQAGTNLGQTTLGGFLLAVDKVQRELRQYDRMVAQNSIGTKIGRAAIQQECDRGGLPTGCSRRSHLAWPSWWCIRGRAHIEMIIELAFDPDPKTSAIRNAELQLVSCQ